MKLNTTQKVPFPTVQEFAKFYDKWSLDMVNKLGGKYPRADCEYAVQQAFFKVMYKKTVGDYNKVPETEEDWYENILWQAKGILSHLAESHEIWTGYHKRAYAECYLNLRTWKVCNIDREVADKTAFDTLYALCDEAGMKRRNIEAFVCCYLNGEDSADVERRTGIKTNNIYQIKKRIMDLLALKGPAKFRELRRKNFISAV